jgi:glycosyltransferase involved in cell wall biosynthesis
MKVAILWLGRVSQDTGGRTYFDEILGPLGEQPQIEVDVHLGDAEFEVPASCRAVHHRVPHRLGAIGRIAAQAWLARKLVGKYDVLLAPFNFLPATWAGPSVVVQHNVVAGRGAHSFAPWEGPIPLRTLYRRRAVASSVRRASQVLAVSEHLRGLLLDWYPWLDPAKVRVAPLAASTRLVEAARSGAPGPVAEPTVLVVGALWSYKRVDYAIEVFASATAGLPRAWLVIIGPGDEPARTKLRAIAAKLGVGERVELCGTLQPSALAQKYAEATALLFVSDRESFGLPVIEAMAIGVPVVASKIEALAEIAGDAPIWIPIERDVPTASSALRRTLTDADFRRRHRETGRDRAALYSWDRTAELTAAALRRAVDGWPGIRG